MKCKSCPFGEPYTLYPDSEDEPIDLVQCPFGEQVFHLADKRCIKFQERKDAMEAVGRSGEDEEQISKTD